MSLILFGLILFGLVMMRKAHRHPETFRISNPVRFYAFGIGVLLLANLADLTY